MIIISNLMNRMKTRASLDLMGRYSGGGRPAVNREAPLAIREYHRVFGKTANADDVWKAREAREESLNAKRLADYGSMPA
ncbi:hypothetical protein [Sulfitobacter sp. R18_1]|uniref:hypothetical protein n=1 Tax=Sulfitobacter sp. R18_1 TaxID=2821104 RepID=UPI001ADC05B7|nr:hypothetical protein [Sulfitobacter sp. R18_1]MBO9428803.1 hypothetical protein [Sulfitobacter sp. R18_1]